MSAEEGCSDALDVGFLLRGIRIRSLEESPEICLNTLYRLVGKRLFYAIFDICRFYCLIEAVDAN